MPLTNHRLKVYLYSAKSDRNIVESLHDRLSFNEVDILFPAQDLPDLLDPEFEDQFPDQQKRKVEVLKMVQESDVVLFCLSPQFNEEVSRSREFQLVINAILPKRHGDIAVLPVRLQECEVPKNLNRWQPIDLFEDPGYEKLMLAVKLRAEKIGINLPPQNDWKLSFYVKESEKKEIKVKRSRNSLLIFGIIFIAIIFSVVMLFQTHLIGLVPTEVPTMQVDLLAVNATQHARNRSENAASTQTAFVLEYSVPLTQTAVYITTAEPLTETATVEFGLITPTITLTSVSLPTQIMEAENISMVLVPGSSFYMGEYTSDTPAIYLDTYYIDQYEVTNAQYKVCVDSGTCQPPLETGSQTHPDYYVNSAFADYPIINVDWNMARAYCEWRGAHLPTEAEWEKAARGTQPLMYPWGDGIECYIANHNRCVGDTAAVNRYIVGTSMYGAFNMSGNVTEWVSSLYLPYPYDPLDGREDLTSDGPRVARGGSWNSPPEEVTTYYRFELSPVTYKINGNDLGFRCARGATP